MILIFLGKPGSGKGTQAAMVAEKLRIPTISMGELLREIATQDTPLARTVKEVTGKGNLLGDDLIINILEERIEKNDCKKGFILDGFPRTVNQAEIFNKKVDKVIYIDVRNETIIDRLSSRRECPTCRAIFNVITNPPKKEGICDNCGAKLIIRKDDNPETIKNRLKVYEESTKPLIDYYTKKGLLMKVNGEQAIEDILNEILTILKK